MRVTRLAGAAALVALLAAGCAGEPTGGQAEVQGVTSTAAEAVATGDPAATQRSATKGRGATTQPSATTGRGAITGPATTTRRTVTPGQPAVNPILRVYVVEGAAGGVVVTPPGEPCPSKCRYDKFPKGQTIQLEPVEAQTAVEYEVRGGQSRITEYGTCEVTLSMNTTVTVTAPSGTP